MKAKRIHIAFSVLLIAILACNAPNGQQLSPSDLAATITAQALTLQVPSNTPAPLAVTFTGTPSAPEVRVTSNTNCRTGPSTAYDLVFTLNPGQTVPVVGKNTPTNYWIINNASGGTCWLWGQNVVVTGDTSILPEYPPPPVPTAKFTKTPKPTSEPKNTSTPKNTDTPPSPNAPSGLTIATRDCAGGYNGATPIWIETIKVTWQDNANNETGYHMYKDGSKLPDLPANSTEYNITLRYDQGTGGALYINFGVEAFNDAGASARPTVDATTCP